MDWKGTDAGSSGSNSSVAGWTAPDVKAAVGGWGTKAAAQQSQGGGKGSGSSSSKSATAARPKEAAAAGSLLSTSESTERTIRQMVEQGRVGRGVELLVEASRDDKVAIARELVNFVLYVCMRKKDWARALAVIQSGTIKVDNVGFTMAIRACGRALKWKEVSRARSTAPGSRRW